eukprot:202401_1
MTELRANQSLTRTELQANQSLTITELQADKKQIDSYPTSSPNIQEALSRIKDVQNEKYIGAFVSVYIILAFSVLFYSFNGHGQFYHFIALLFLTLWIMYIVYFIYIVCNVKSLHYILILRKPLDNFNTDSLFIPYKIFEDKTKPITSVSHLFALRGSNFEKTSTLILSMAFGMIFAAVSNKWTQEIDIRIKIELIILMASGFCCIFLVSWDISTETKYSQTTDILHYIIAVLTLILPPISFIMNQNGSILSVTLFIMILILVIIWCVVLDKIFKIEQNHDQEHFDSKKIHRISLIYLSTELLAVTVVVITMIIFIYCMQNDVIL